MSDPVSTQPTRPSLLIRIRDPQDQDAWATFVDAYSRMLKRLEEEVRILAEDVPQLVPLG